MLPRVGAVGLSSLDLSVGICWGKEKGREGM